MPGRGNSRGEQSQLATGSQQVKDRVKDGAQVGRAWPPTRPGCRQVRGDPGPGGVVEIGVVASGAHGSRNRADEPCFARGGSTSHTPSYCKPFKSPYCSSEAKGRRTVCAKVGERLPKRGGKGSKAHRLPKGALQTRAIQIHIRTVSASENYEVATLPFLKNKTP